MLNYSLLEEHVSRNKTKLQLHRREKRQLSGQLSAEPERGKCQTQLRKGYRIPSQLSQNTFLQKSKMKKNPQTKRTRCDHCSEAFLNLDYLLIQNTFRWQPCQQLITKVTDYQQTYHQCSYLMTWYLQLLQGPTTC